MKRESFYGAAFFRQKEMKKKSNGWDKNIFRMYSRVADDVVEEKRACDEFRKTKRLEVIGTV